MHAPVGAVRGNGSIPRAVTPVLRSPPAAPCVALFRATRRPRALSSRTAPCVACASRLFPLGMGVRADCDLAHLGPAAYHGGASGEARGRGCHVLSLRELRKVRLVPAAGHGALPALQDGAHPRAPALCRLRLDASPAARRIGARHDAKALLFGGPSLADPPPRRSCAPASCSGSGGKWPSASKFRGNSPRWRASALIRIGATWANAP